MTEARGRIFRMGRSQVVRLPREFRLPGHTVSIRRAGNSIILEPVDEWPDDYVASFARAEAIERQPQGTTDDPPHHFDTLAE